MQLLPEKKHQPRLQHSCYPDTCDRVRIVLHGFNFGAVHVCTDNVCYVLYSNDVNRSLLVKAIMPRVLYTATMRPVLGYLWGGKARHVDAVHCGT